ncbi:MAG: hypothetical protein VYE12_03470 [Actinomycetota bacterium]|jgi:hypothetical protein|nr:hypothetical protein [Actinomycetota bacterium]MED5328970.1 hypothetical protein [Actinomycetota bacterium]MED5570468.1 hypothetical protein [Actinomycetota bacterium]
MAYPQKLLNPGEETIVDLHPHWWFFVKEALFSSFLSPLPSLLR